MSKATYTYQESKNNITIKETIPLEGVSSLVDNVVSMVVDESGYRPQVYDLALFYQLLRAYTDYEDSLQDTDALERIYQLMLCSDLWDCMIGTINQRQYAGITGAIERQIEFKKQMLAQKDEFDALCGDLRVLAGRLDQYTQGLDDETTQAAMRNLAKLTEIDEVKVVDALTQKAAEQAAHNTTAVDFGGASRGERPLQGTLE